jgi:hypothetical protein
MNRISLKILMTGMAIAAAITGLFGQSVPYGIHYQAVARDNTGKELSDRTIDVRFTVISGTPLGAVAYQEVHQGVRTSKYGVFTLIIGSGVPVGGTAGELSQVEWSSGPHYLKVEIKFINEFADMGTMQFLSVPYALFAGKSLEPGPQGPPGPQGDPASDKQQLSFDGVNLTISGEPGNTVNLSALVNDADNDPANELQTLFLKGDSLFITKGNSVILSPYIQDLRLTGNILKITRNSEASEIDLSKYMDNTDDQMLTWNPETRVLGLTNSTFQIDFSRVLTFNESTGQLSISGGNNIDLSSLKNDADANPTNELITSMQLTGSELRITEGGTQHTVDFASNMVAFRARRDVSVAAPQLEDIKFTPSFMDHNDGNAFNPSSGDFTAPVKGIYTFNITYKADGSGGARNVSLFLNSSLYEKIAVEVAGGAEVLVRSVTMKLNAGDTVNMMIYTGLATETGTGTFSGYRVY